MEQLNERIKRILVNTNYDNSKTLSENSEMIEQRAGAQSLKNIEGAFKNLGGLRRLLNIGVDEAKLLKFMSMDAKNFQTAFVKVVKQDAAAGHSIASGLGPKAKELSKIDFARRVADETAAKGRQLSKAEMDAIKSATKLDNVGSAGKVKINKKPIDVNTPPIKPNVPPPGPGNKNLGLFKKWAKKVGYVGLTSAALYALYKHYYGTSPSPTTSKCSNIVKKFTEDGYKKITKERYDSLAGDNTRIRKYEWCPEGKVHLYFAKIKVVRGGGDTPRGNRYGFNYQEALNALKSKGCKTSGGGSSEEDSFVDDWRTNQDQTQTVDTTVSKETILNWAS